MSGIAGILHFNNMPAEEEQLRWMLGTLKTRGPAGGNIYLSEGVGLGQTAQHKRTGIDLQKIPFIHPNRPYVVVFDGRIDNRSELKNRLGISESFTKSLADEQIILAAYEHWGQDCADKLIGDFAFAIWDSIEKKLVCARDHFGVKPFYYFISEQCFVFGSSPYSILAAKTGTHPIHEARIADFLLSLEGEDRTSTFYENIYRLPHGHTLVVDGSTIRQKQYWELRASKNSEIKTDADYLEAFREKFYEAVGCRLTDPIETAISLSGGLDSSAIFGAARDIAAHKGNKNLNVYSFISPNESHNRETRYIQAILAQHPIEPNLVSKEEVKVWSNDLIQHLGNIDEPFDWHMNIWRMLYKPAQENGIGGFLDGVDGDILLADSNLGPYLWRSGQIGAALGETLLAKGLATYYSKPWSLFYQSLKTSFAPQWMKSIRMKQRRSNLVAEAIEHSIINPDFAQEIRLRERLERYQSYRVSPSELDLVEAHRTVFSHPHLQAALERYERVAAEYSIESRHPLLDVRLAEFCLGLAWHLKTKRGWTKMAMRKMMENLLPNEVVWRKDKDSLAWSINYEILKINTPLFKQILDEDKHTLENYIDLSKLKQQWDGFLLTGDPMQASLILDAAALAFWLRRQKGLI